MVINGAMHRSAPVHAVHRVLLRLLTPSLIGGRRFASPLPPYIIGGISAQPKPCKALFGLELIWKSVISCIPKVINAAACQPTAFCFALAAIYHRRHFGRAETVQSPAQLTVDFEICDFFINHVTQADMRRRSDTLKENQR